MKTNFCLTALTISSIGFLTYLLIMVVSFLGCCIGADEGLYNIIVAAIVSIAAIVAGVLLYGNCKK